MNELTQRERDTLYAIERFIAEVGYAPSVRELCEMLQVKSTSTVQYRLADLTYKGYLKRVKGQPRTLQVVKP